MGVFRPHGLLTHTTQRCWCSSRVVSSSRHSHPHGHLSPTKGPLLAASLSHQPRSYALLQPQQQQTRMQTQTQMQKIQRQLQAQMVP
jgi:hypothetical protein